MPYIIRHKPRGKPRERLLLIGGFGEDLYAAVDRTNFLVEEVLDGAEAQQCAAQREYGVVLCSLRMSNAWGLDVMSAILKADPAATVIMSTHEQHPQVIVEAMRRGAFDYIIEPYADIGEVMAVIERAARRRETLREARKLRDALAGGQMNVMEQIVGRSSRLRELCDQIRQAAPAPSPVLIEGPSGSGKELVARAIHEASARRGRPYISVNCGAIAENLLESELFGHEKGAFTGADSTRVGLFEEAHGGTLFLDEIGLMSAGCQAKLLRVLEGGVLRRVGASRELRVDVRIVAATNEPLEQLVAAKRFRHDVFYRLNVVNLKVPALAQRPEDIEPLAYHFAGRFAKAASRPFEAFSHAALEALKAYAYPGNVRELRNIIERAVVFSRGPVIGLADLPEPLRAAAGSDALERTLPPAVGAARDATILSDSKLSLDERLLQIEKNLVAEALADAKGNRSEAARRLKINRTTLLQKMARLGLAEAPESPKAGARSSKSKK